MKIKSNWLLAPLLSLALLVARPTAAHPQNPAGEVEALERELVAAIGRGDLVTYDRIVADDYIVFAATGPETTKAEILKSYRSGALHFTGLEIFDVTARVFGDTAVVGAKTKGLRREGDQNVPNRVRYIRVYALRDGRWRAVAQMSAQMVEQPPAPTPTPGAPRG
jgi:ketosteroid isomerase-like protein